MENSLYSQLAERVVEQIRNGVYQVGDKLPSVRKMAQREQVSISTVNSAYSLLDDRGWVEARLKSGYYVSRQGEDRLASPTQRKRVAGKPRPATLSELVMEVQSDGTSGKGIVMGTAFPCRDFPVVKQLQRTFAKLARTENFLGLGYDSPLGLPELRQQIARRAVDAGIFVTPDEVITTAGCQNALSLCLRVLTEPGDIIAVETPCYYGLLQIVEAYGLKAIEIPSHPEQGMSLEALKLALDKWPIKVIMTVAAFSNPIGSQMPDSVKMGLIQLLKQHDIYLVEDDIYGDLYYSGPRPKAIKAFDDDGRVLLCSSVSKTLDPQLRVGWILPGRFFDKVNYRKFINSIAMPRLPQMVVAEMLTCGGYDRHLRQARECYRQRYSRLVDLVNEYFPEGTRLSRPQGGFVAWFEMPKGIDTTQLYHKAHGQGVLIAPGEIFSTTGHYHNCFRISFAHSWTKERENAVRMLGQWAKELLQ